MSTVCTCGHASGHHDFQQNSRCLRVTCGCTTFSPDESADVPEETFGAVRAERDAFVSMYSRSQEGTTWKRRLMLDALGIEDGPGHDALLMSVCTQMTSARYQAFADSYFLARQAQAKMDDESNEYIVAGEAAQAIAKAGKLSPACCISLNERAEVPIGKLLEDGTDDRKYNDPIPGIKYP